MTTIIAGRRERIASIAFDYASQPARAVEACNLCGGRRFIVLTHRDRYAFPAQAHGCADCGLVFLNPVMTAEAYARFYERTYRPLVSAYHGRVIDARTIQDEQRLYAAECGDLLASWLPRPDLRTLLDVGGSTGVVAHALAMRFGLQATVVDPAPDEARQAQHLGLETIEGLVETVDFGRRRFDVVVLCQTVDHLLDVAGTLRRLRNVINDEGLLSIDIVDFRAAYLRNWSVEEAIKIDHPYYLTEDTMAAYLARAGFDVLRSAYAADRLHVGFVCRPALARPEAMPPHESVEALWREVRFVQNAPRPFAIGDS